MSRWSAFADPPIVIGGCGRSGTTVLLSLLGAHPEIHAIPHETRIFCLFAEQSTDADERRELLEDPDFGREARLARLDEVLGQDPIRATARRWCEKTPRNVLCFEEIAAIFAGRVKLIHLVRDGRDVVSSRHPLDPSRPWVSPDRWIRDLEAGRRYAGQAALHTLRYEDLVTDPAGVLRALGAFLEVEGLDALAGWRERTNIKSSGAWRNPELQPLHADSVGRWRERPEEPAVAALLADPRGRALLGHYGYLDQMQQ